MSGRTASKLLHILMFVLAVLQVLVAGAAALVGSFADGADIISRGVLVGLHPIAAVALVIGLLAPGASPAIQQVVQGLLGLNVLADLALSGSIAFGYQGGDAVLPLIFAVIPAIGLVYIRRRHWAPPQ